MDQIYTVKMKKIAFTKMRKLEVFTFYNEVVDIISKYDTKEMHIENTCNVLIDLKPKSELLDLTEKDFGPHPLTSIINELHERRFKSSGVITNHMRTLEMANLSGTLHLMELIKPVIVTHLNYLRQSDQVDVTQIIMQFFDELDDNSEIKDAMYELGFEPYLVELQSAQKAYIENRSERRAQLSRRPKGSTLPVQREIQRILKILFEQIDFLQHVYKDVDYSKLIASLNHTIATYTKLIKTRDTQRKNKKLKAEKDAQAALDDDGGDDNAD